MDRGGVGAGMRRGALVPAPFALLLALALVLTLPLLRQVGVAGRIEPAQVTTRPPCAAGGSALVAACLSEFMMVANGTWAGADLARAPAVVAVRTGPGAPAEHRLATLVDTGSVWGLATVEMAPVVYAAAFQTRGQPFVRVGPGAVYRLDLLTGTVDLWATVPDAGGETHSDGPDLDEPARNGAGKRASATPTPLDDGRELAVVNLADRRIYRFAVPGGELLGSFAHGASGEAWAADARPFGLAYHDGRLYHGVVNTAESSQARASWRPTSTSRRRTGADCARCWRCRSAIPRGEARLAGLAGSARSRACRWPGSPGRTATTWSRRPSRPSTPSPSWPTSPSTAPATCCWACATARRT